MPSGTEPPQGRGWGTALSPESQLGTFWGRSTCPAAACGKESRAPLLPRAARLQEFSAPARPPLRKQPASRFWTRFLRGPEALGCGERRHRCAGMKGPHSGSAGDSRTQRGLQTRWGHVPVGGAGLALGAAPRPRRALAALGLRVLQASPSARGAELRRGLLRVPRCSRARAAGQHGPAGVGGSDLTCPAVTSGQRASEEQRPEGHADHPDPVLLGPLLELGGRGGRRGRGRGSLRLCFTIRPQVPPQAGDPSSVPSLHRWCLGAGPSLFHRAQPCPTCGRQEGLQGVWTGPGRSALAWASRV